MDSETLDGNGAAPADQADIDGSSLARHRVPNGDPSTGVLIHDTFVQGRPLPRWLHTLDGFPADSYGELFDVVAAPVRVTGSAVQQIMDGDLTPLHDLRRRSWVPVEEFGLFYDAWLAVAHRSTTMHKDHAEFSTATEVSHTEPNLFGFFVNGMAVFDSFAFAVYAASSMLSPSRFPLRTPKDRRQVGVASTAKVLRTWHPAARITRVVGELLKAEEYGELSDFRNVLAHRASPGFRTQPGGADAEWMTEGHRGENVPLRPETLDRLLQWSMAELSLLTTNALAFYRDRFAQRLGSAR